MEAFGLFEQKVKTLMKGRVEEEEGPIEYDCLNSLLSEMTKLFNGEAMKLLEKGKHSKGNLILSRLMLILTEVQDQLDSAKVPKIHTLISMTLNNLSCIFKKSGKLLSAE